MIGYNPSSAVSDVCDEKKKVRKNRRPCVDRWWLSIMVERLHNFVVFCCYRWRLRTVKLLSVSDLTSGYRRKDYWRKVGACNPTNRNKDDIIRLAPVCFKSEKLSICAYIRIPLLPLRILRTPILLLLPLISPITFPVKWTIIQMKWKCHGYVF